MKKSISLLVICTYMTALWLTQTNAAMSMWTNNMTNGSMYNGYWTLSNGNMTTSDDEEENSSMSSDSTDNSTSINSRSSMEDSDYKEVDWIDSASEELVWPNKINWNLEVANFSFNWENGNLIVTWNADWLQFDYENWDIFIDWNFTYANISWKGNLFVKWNIDSSSIDIDWDLYVYGKLDCANISVTWKIKVVKDSDWASLERGRFYSFAKKANFANFWKDRSPVSWLFAKIDPLLQIDLPNEDYTAVTTKLINATKEIEKLKKDLLLSYGKYKKWELDWSKIANLKTLIINIKTEALNFAEQYLENTDFDREQFKKVKSFEDASTKAFLAKYILKDWETTSSMSTTTTSSDTTFSSMSNDSQTSTSTTDNTSTASWSQNMIETRVVLPEKLKNAIDRLVDKYNTDEKKTKVLNILITKITALTEWKEETTKVKLLVALKDYCKEKLDEVNWDVSDNLLNNLIEQ